MVDLLAQPFQSQLLNN